MGIYLAIIQILILIFLVTSVSAGVTTTRYYDNRKAAVVITADDWYGCEGYHNAFIAASDLAQESGVVLSVGIVPGGGQYYWQGGPFPECPEAPNNELTASHWADIQNQINEGFVSPVSHSYSHYRIPYSDYALEIRDSKQEIIDNLDLPWQNWYNGQEYIVGYLEPYGMSNSTARWWLAQSDYLVDRSIATGETGWASWASDGLYQRVGITTYGDKTTLIDLNKAFNAVYQISGIYHMLFHPQKVGLGDNDKIPQHFKHISGYEDVWYVGFGQLYMYRYLNPTITIIQNGDVVEFKATVSPFERQKYGLGYPKTYKVDYPWKPTVLVKDSFSANYSQMMEHSPFGGTRLNGINAYRYEPGILYISQAFTDTNELYFLVKND